MGDPKGFMNVIRDCVKYRSVCERVKDFREVAVLPSLKKSMEQSSRCMDCGTAFCHWACPIGNFIPEWNDLVFHRDWEKAMIMLDASNNLPEITGRICPALCEYSCVLGINNDPVTIRENELAIVEHAFKTGFIKPKKPAVRTGKNVAVIGSGPAGISCADQLNRAGHRVTVFERDDKIGGVLRYGIPDFKLDKRVIDRRITLLQKEGIEFVTGLNIGVDYKIGKLTEEYDAISLAGGSRVPRDLKIDGRELSGIHFAMDYLTQSNRRCAGEKVSDSKLIDAKGKKVVVIGGGDTGADCVGTANRQGASCVVQIEVLPKPSECRPDNQPWPRYPLVLKTSTSHEEGGHRHWAILTKKFVGHNGNVSGLRCMKLDFSQKDASGCPLMKEVPDSEFDIEADLVIIAVGFLHTEHGAMIEDLRLKLDRKGNVLTDEKYKTSSLKIFAAGDLRRGQSLVVWAISEGRSAARYIDKHLMGSTLLPVL
jgi:glutamate synthase (NADPH) small chain